MLHRSRSNIFIKNKIRQKYNKQRHTIIDKFKVKFGAYRLLVVYGKRAAYPV
jgi:hypothetical protein